MRYLKQLEKLLEIAEQYSPDQSALEAQLHADMFPLGVQARIAIRFTLRACCPLADRPLPESTEDEISFAVLRGEIRDALAILTEISQASLPDPASITVEERAGFAQQNLSGDDFLYLYALPNFLFHLSMVYAILRHLGAPLSKGDFDGFHSYPAGFSFAAQQQDGH